jgi:hypothetical protein
MQSRRTRHPGLTFPAIFIRRTSQEFPATYSLDSRRRTTK